MSNNNVYYTALINNDGSTIPSIESNVEPNFIFQEDRKVSLIDNPEEYEVAVQSCMIDLKSIPVFIPTIKYNTAPTDKQKTETIYEVTLEYDGYSATTPIYYEPQNQTLSLPNFNNGYANYKSGYYILYNYEFFLQWLMKQSKQLFLN